MGFQFEVPKDTNCVENDMPAHKSIIYKTCKQIENSE